MDTETLQILSETGTALAREPDVDRVLETILLGAQRVTRADGATLYKLVDGHLEFLKVHSNSPLIGAAGSDSFPPIPLCLRDGSPNTRTVVSFAVLNGITVNIPDAYRCDGFDFAGTRAFDRQTGYRSRSFLTVPIKDAAGGVIAALQLINAQEAATGEVIGFSSEHQRLAEALASQVAVALEKQRLARYEQALTGSIVIRGAGGARQLSKNHLVALLEICAIPRQVADGIAVKVLRELVERSAGEIGAGALQDLILATLDAELDGDAVRRFQAWTAFRQSGLPLMVLIGGCTGTGKSTVAAELSLHLDIGRIQSSDILREVMRLLVSEELAPELHASTYEAWRGIDCPPPAPGDQSARLVEGFSAQAKKVSVAIDGVLRRAVRERVSTIIEGIHVEPGLHRRYAGSGAVVVPVLLAIASPDDLKHPPSPPLPLPSPPSREANRPVR